jgi:chitodextrinase
VHRAPQRAQQVDGVRVWPEHRPGQSLPLNRFGLAAQQDHWPAPFFEDGQPLSVQTVQVLIHDRSVGLVALQRAQHLASCGTRGSHVDVLVALVRQPQRQDASPAYAEWDPQLGSRRDRSTGGHRAESEPGALSATSSEPRRLAATTRAQPVSPPFLQCKTPARGPAVGPETAPGARRHPAQAPPSVPANVTAAVTQGNTVNVSWSASTDNVGVVGYDVYRNSVFIAKVGAPNTTYTDLGVPAGTYTYTVDAFDAAGNHSAQSTPSGSVTTVTPPPPPAGVNEPPPAGHQIISFPSRDFVTASGYLAADGPFLVQVYRAGGGG